MKAIFLTAGSDGDVHPHLAVASELRARGHEVLFFTTFEYVEPARALGLRPVEVLGGAAKRGFAETASRLRGLARIRAYRDFLSARVADCSRLVASEIDRESVLIAPLAMSGIARLLHDAYGTAYVSTLLTPADLISLRDPPFYRSLRHVLGLPYQLRTPLFHIVERSLIDPICRQLLGPAARDLGRALPKRMYSRWLYSPQRIVGLFPDWLCSLPPDWPPQVVRCGFPLFRVDAGQLGLPQPLLRFIEAGPPPVAVTAGTETTRARAFFEAAVQALQAEGLRGIVLTRLAEQVPPLPDGIVHEAYLPLEALLPRVAAFVHHGGIGTAAAALRAGVPQLMLPTFSNQFDNARRVAALGCGITLERGRGAEALGSALRTLGTPAIAERCRSVQRLTEPGEIACGRAADAIERTWRASHRSGGGHGASGVAQADQPGTRVPSSASRSGDTTATGSSLASSTAISSSRSASA